ncbi:MAG: TIGR01212 family radical SAM protein [Paludibacteraceae bacterium]|nr:TIGR01212 family radical SAM protein [Paludibacteraceae bacterium]
MAVLEKRYNDYASYLKKIFPEKVQKISINAGFSCPNRDGSIGIGGCTYCNNQTFNPEYCKPDKSITQQMQEGMDFFKKYEGQKYLAYFQAYTNTYGSFENLKRKYEEALTLPDVYGIVIGTRPDCVSIELLDYLSELSKNHYVMIEYGLESTLERTLILINRGHNYTSAVKAIEESAKRGLNTCAHLILGLPQESQEEILEHATTISQLPLTTIKLHQLQIIKGTKMAQQYETHPEWFHIYTADEYIDMAIDFTERLNPDFVIERFVSQSPQELRIEPNWGLKNYEFTAKLEKRMVERDTYQGKKWRGKRK